MPDLLFAHALLFPIKKEDDAKKDFSFSMKMRSQLPTLLGMKNYHDIENYHDKKE